jgi:hypothetical protein
VVEHRRLLSTDELSPLTKPEYEGVIVGIASPKATVWEEAVIPSVALLTVTVIAIVPPET